MIIATVLDAEMRPLSDDFVIFDDDLLPAVSEARRLADIGTKCCIQWQRGEDDQVAYYGPRGCQLQPYWYGPTGRPSTVKDGRRVNVWLDRLSVDRAKVLGAGNVSDGIRTALAASLMDARD